MTIYNEAGLLFWNTSNVAGSLPTSQFRPIIYVDAASNSYTFNIYGIKVDGNSEAPATPTESFVGIMYRNAQGTVGNSSDTGRVQIVDIDGAGGVTDNTIFGFGLVCMGTANPLIQYTTFTGYHNVAIASIGRSLSSTLTSQMPNPIVADCIITGTTQNNTGWYSGIMNSFGGKVTARRNFITAHRNSMTTFYASGILIYDGRNALIGSGSVKSDGNNIIDNDWGLNVIVTNTIIGTPSLYTIKNNNIAYNGNSESGLTCTGTQATSGCVRYDNSTSAADRILALPSNAWGNADPLNNGYGISTGSPVAAGASTDAFWSVSSGDKMTVASPVAATTENVDPSYSAATVGFGYSTFNTIQRAVNAAGNPSTILVKDSTTYTENVCVFNKNNVTIVGDSTATCGSSSKPVINPASGNGMHIYTLSGGTGRTTNITVNGFYFLQVGAQEVGLLVTGTDNTNADATNLPPTGIRVRNTCFEDYATQAADGVPAGSAAMATEESPFNNTTRQSYGENVAPAVSDPTDVDASANNNMNFNGSSTSPSFKVWDKTDADILDGGPGAPYNVATILQTNLIIVYCGDDLNTALAGLGAGPVTVYLQGDCIYKSASRLTISGVFDIGVDYTGRYQLPPLVVEPAGIVYANSTAGLNWDDDCAVAGNPGVRFVTNATQLPLAASLTNGDQPSGTVANASATYMKTLTPVNYGAGGYDYETTNFGTNRPADIELLSNVDAALTDAINHIVDSNGYAGTVTVPNASAFTANIDLQKRIRIAVASGGNATTTGWIRLRNKVVPNGPDCATTANTTPLDGILDTRVTSGTFTSLDVRVGTPTSAVATEWADNTDTTNTIQQGLTFTSVAGTCTVNNLGNYSSGTVQTPLISRQQTILTSDDAAQFVQLEGGYITLNGSGTPAFPSSIVRFSVDTVKMTLGTDAIQTALGVAGSQDDEGVGFDNQAGNTTGATAIAPATQRVGTIVFNFAGASSSQTLIVEKDARFKGNSATPNTNSGSLSMRLGAQGTNIAGSTDFCNNTVNVTQTAGSGYTQIPDIQDGILLSCSSGTLNVGTTATTSSWGGGSDTYNRDNSITKPLTVQATNNAALCGFDGTTYVVDGASTPAALAGRTNYSRFTGFAVNNPVFRINAVNNVTIQGFDFLTLNGGAASAIIYSDSLSSTIAIRNNNFDESSTRAIYSASAIGGSNKTNWTVECNWIHRTAGGTTGPADGIALERHSTTNVIQDNAIDYNGYTTVSTNGVRLYGVQNAQILRNYIRGAAGATVSNISIDSLSTGTGQGSGSGTLNIAANDLLGNNNGTWGGIGIAKAAGMSGTITIQNNFIRSNTTGIALASTGSAAISNTNWSIINNSFTNTTNGITYLPNYNGAVCQLNARGNWWEDQRGPTNTFNPLNTTPCAASAYGDAISSVGTCNTGQQSMVSYIPWYTSGTDAAAATDGWQPPVANSVLGRVVVTDNTNAFVDSYCTITGAHAGVTGAGYKITVIQGVFGWTPVADAPGCTDDVWGSYFSEAVPNPPFNTTTYRATTIAAYDCGTSTLRTWNTYLAGTNNITAPLPSGDASAHAPSATITGTGVNGFTTSRNSTTYQNFKIQGFSSTTPNTAGAVQGAGIFSSNNTGTAVDLCYFEGGSTSSTHGAWGIFLDRSTVANITSSTFSANRDISSTSGGVGGVGVMQVDATGANTANGPNTIGATAASAFYAGLGGLNGNNLISNCERAAVHIGGGGASNVAAGNGGSAGATTIVNYNTIQGSRDVKGSGGAVSLAAVYCDATGGTVQINNNIIGGKAPNTDNNIDIYLGSQAVALGASSNNNTIRDSSDISGTTGVVDGENYTVTDEAGTRGASLRTFFNPASGNTFSHAAILTTDATAPYSFGTQMGRSANATTIAGTTRIYRQIATPLANTTTVFSAGSETYNNVIEIRENAGWTAGERDQYYSEDLAFQSTTGRLHQVILGPAVANALNTTSAHLISTTGTGTVVTAAGQENKYIRGGIVLHAIGNGLYGSIPAGASNKGDVYLQRAASGTDAGFVQFAYHATTFGSEALVSGTGTELTGNNNNTDKPSIIKAGLDDANDDSYTNTAAQNRRTGVFQAGNGTVFTKPIEPVAGLGTEGLVAYPNPATGGEVTVNFQVPNDTYVRIALYDALGRKVTELKSETVTAGVYNTSFDISNLPSGAYTVRMEYDYFTKAVPVAVVK
ncbi:MAG: T9SS type A sorting domain-containing protein [Bacteroidetes bacterium]|nr:T9SS type A sorting domain-containing protein [Bacteroidota bacterium]